MKTLIAGVCFLVMAVPTFSQKNWPKWIQFDKDTVALSFTEPQVDVLGQKLLIKDYLVAKNYEMEKQIAFLTEERNALRMVVDEKNREIARLDYENRISQSAAEMYKLNYKEQQGETNKWRGKYEQMKGRRNTWRGIALAEFAYIVVREGVPFLLR